MQQNIEFERCIDFLVRMIDKYGVKRNGKKNGKRC